MLREFLGDKSSVQTLVGILFPVFFFLVLDVVAITNGADVPVLGLLLTFVNLCSAIILVFVGDIGIIGVSLCSFLLYTLPVEFVGASATVYLVLYPLSLAVARGQWISALIGYSGIGIVAYFGASQPSIWEAAVHFLIVLAFSLPIALYLRHLLQNAEEMKKELMDAQSSFQRMMENRIHDTALTSLTREVLRVRALALKEEDPNLGAELRSIEEGLRQTSQSLRAIFTANETHEYTPENLKDVMANGRKMLASRDCQLDVSVSPGCLALLPFESQQLILAAIREAFTNAAKYALEGSRVTIDLSEAEHSVDLCVSSLYVSPKTNGDFLSSGRGLAGLEYRAQQLGIDFFAGPVAGRWLTTMSLPLSPHNSVLK